MGSSYPVSYRRPSPQQAAAPRQPGKLLRFPLERARPGAYRPGRPFGPPTSVPGRPSFGRVPIGTPSAPVAPRVPWGIGGRVLGRLIPLVGWGLLAYDLYKALNGDWLPWQHPNPAVWRVRVGPCPQACPPYCTGPFTQLNVGYNICSDNQVWPAPTGGTAPAPATLIGVVDWSWGYQRPSPRYKPVFSYTRVMPQPNPAPDYSPTPWPTTRPWPQGISPALDPPPLWNTGPPVPLPFPAIPKLPRSPFPEDHSRGYAVNPYAPPAAGGEVEGTSGQRPRVRPRNLPRRRQRPPRTEREKKTPGTSFAAKAAFAGLKAMAAYSEFNDFLDVLWKAIPKRYRTPGAGLQQRYRDVWNNWHRIKIGDAFVGYLANEVEDQIIGRGLARARQASQFGLGENRQDLWRNLQNYDNLVERARPPTDAQIRRAMERHTHELRL